MKHPWCYFLIQICLQYVTFFIYKIGTLSTYCSMWWTSTLHLTFYAFIWRRMLISVYLRDTMTVFASIVRPKVLLGLDTAICRVCETSVAAGAFWLKMTFTSATVLLGLVTEGLNDSTHTHQWQLTQIVDVNNEWYSHRYLLFLKYYTLRVVSKPISATGCKIMCLLEILFQKYR